VGFSFVTNASRPPLERALARKVPVLREVRRRGGSREIEVPCGVAREASDALGPRPTEVRRELDERVDDERLGRVVVTEREANRRPRDHVRRGDLSARAVHGLVRDGALEHEALPPHAHLEVAARAARDTIGAVEHERHELRVGPRPHDEVVLERVVLSAVVDGVDARVDVGRAHSLVAGHIFLVGGRGAHEVVRAPRQLVVTDDPHARGGPEQLHADDRIRRAFRRGADLGLRRRGALRGLGHHEHGARVVS
jgi:hypothetical protein